MQMIARRGSARGELMIEQDRALLNRFFPPDPTQPEERTAEHLSAEEAEKIFRQAEQEIQPLLCKMRRESFFEGAEMVLCFCVILGAYAGLIWQCITYPQILVLLYTKATNASITTTLDIPTRTLAPITITRRESITTTGTGYQKARAANGTLTFYNGLFTIQEIPAGTRFIGRNGMNVITTEAASIPASDPSTTPPQEGYVTVTAQAQQPGAAGNIAAYDINATVANGVSVKNTRVFQNGQDARTFKAVAAKDLITLTLTLNQTVTQAFTMAFPLQPGEEAIPTNCTTKTTPTHHIGEEALSVTLTISKTCSAIAYNRKQLEQQATEALTQIKPGANYHLIGSVQTTVQSVMPLSVTTSGKWVYTFTPDYEQFLAGKIAGDSPAKAKAYLLRTGVISYASVPSTLSPDAMYINFLVLVG